MTVERFLADAMPQLAATAEQLAEALGAFGHFEAALRETTAALVLFFRSLDWEAAIREEAIRRELTTEADIRRVYYDDDGWWIQQHNWRRILVRSQT